MSRVIVLGSNGYIGRHLVSHLALAMPVISVQRRGKIGVLALDDLTSGEFRLTESDVIIDCMGSSSPELSQVHPVQTVESEILLKANIISLCSKIRCTYIFISTGGAIYEDYPHKINEEHKISPKSIYGISKHTTEQILINLADQFGFKSAIVRPANVYGWLFQEARNQKGLINLLISHIQDNTLDSLSLSLAPDVQRDFLWIGDFVQAMEKVIQYTQKSDHNAIFNIGTGVGTSVQQILNKISDAFGNNIIFSPRALRHGEVKSNVLDSSKAETLLAWAPKVDVDSGIELLKR